MKRIGVVKSYPQTMQLHMIGSLRRERALLLAFMLSFVQLAALVALAAILRMTLAATALAAALYASLVSSEGNSQVPCASW